MNITPANRPQNTTFGAWRVPTSSTNSIIANSNFSTLTEQLAFLNSRANDYSLKIKIRDFALDSLMSSHQTILDEKDIAEFKKATEINAEEGFKKLKEFNQAPIIKLEPDQLKNLFKRTAKPRAEMSDAKNKITNIIGNFFDEIS